MEGEGRFERSAGRAPALALVGEPVTFAPPSLPGHRMLRVQVRNDEADPVALRHGRVELIDDNGTELGARCAFGRAREATTGAATIAAGQVLTLDFVWRARAGAGIPVAVELAGTRLDLIAVATSARPS